MHNKCWWIRNNKGMVLFFVLMLVFMETILAGIILGIIRSNDRNTAHRISRIKAYYAVKAAMAYTYARLYTGNTASYLICPTNTLPGCNAVGTLIDYDIPYRVSITVGNLNTGPAGSRQIIFSTDYTPLL